MQIPTWSSTMHMIDPEASSPNSFRCLTKMTLTDMTISAKDLVIIFKRIVSTLESLSLSYLQVEDGTWSEVFTTLVDNDFPQRFTSSSLVL